MSLLNKKNGSGPAVAAAAARARDAATQVMVKNAVPMAKSAGLTARQGAEGAARWARPWVIEARTWAAPHVEQAGIAVRDKIAPVISDALVEAAHRIDVSAPRRRIWPRVVAGIAMLGAAGSAIAAGILRRRPSEMDFGTAGGTTDHVAGTRGAMGETATGGSTSPASSGPAMTSEADDNEAGANGQIGPS